ncbi:hypothetical protein [Caudoviricetes sp.]|nr:hypothetical protein [Caudoviricetes sp.]
MVFNGDTNKQDAVSDINFWCSTNDVTYPIEDKVRNYIFGLARASAKIMQMDRTWKHVSSNSTSIPIAVKNLVAGQDNYTLATKHVKILRVRIVGKDGKKKTLVGKDRISQSDDILNATGEPEFNDKIGYSVILTPTPDYSVTEGLEIEYQPSADQDVPTVLSTDWQPGFNSDFHRLPNLYASKDYCALFNRDRLPIVMDAIKELEADMEAYFESREIDNQASFEIDKTSRGIGLYM